MSLLSLPLSLLASLLSFSSSFVSSPFYYGALITFGLQWVGFVIASILQTEIFYDVLGGVNFLVLAVLGSGGGGRIASAFIQVVLSLSSSNYGNPNTLINLNANTNTNTNTLNMIFIVLFGISRGWLLLFLAWRAHSRKGDSRFDGVRDVPLKFFKYWMVQGIWVYCISTPLLIVVGNGTGTVADVDVTDVDIDAVEYGSILLLVGMFVSIMIEIWSDITKSIWVINGRKGFFCQYGIVWKLSRHPNYAGEIFTWIFAALYSIGRIITSSGINDNDGGRFSTTILSTIVIASISPLFTIQILCHTSGTGIWNAEGKNLKRYYEHPNQEVRLRYDAYRKTTPPLVPNLLSCLIPIPYEQYPKSIKRWCFFEFDKYEYKHIPKSSMNNKIIKKVD